MNTEEMEMLIKDFYTVESLAVEEGKLQAIIVLNKEHSIFKGHFPGNPVMPGVCSMQIIKELTQHHLACRLQLTSSSNVKFMSLINPEKSNVLRFENEISEDETGIVKVKNTTYFQEDVALKLVNSYKKI